MPSSPLRTCLGVPSPVLTTDEFWYFWRCLRGECPVNVLVPHKNLKHRFNEVHSMPKLDIKKIKTKLAQLCDNEPAQWGNKLRRCTDTTVFLPRKPHLGIPHKHKHVFLALWGRLIRTLRCKNGPPSLLHTFCINSFWDYGTPAVGALFHTTEGEKKTGHATGALRGSLSLLAEEAATACGGRSQGLGAQSAINSVSNLW